jgi:excisionase family DNA binding protein
MPNLQQIDSMLTTRDVAQLLNVHINTVRRWSNRGILNAYRIAVRGDRRFRREDIANFLLQRMGMEHSDAHMKICHSLHQSSGDGEKPRASLDHESNQ